MNAQFSVYGFAHRRCGSQRCRRHHRRAKSRPGSPSSMWTPSRAKRFQLHRSNRVMDQKGLMFSPHIMVVQVGTTVEFLNSDTVQHNVFWPSISGNKKLSHNMGTWPKGEKTPFQI